MATPRSRYEVRDELNAIISEWTSKYTKKEAMDILCKADVPAGAVLDVDDLTKDPYFLKRGVMVEVNHEGRDLILPGFAPRMSENHVEYEDAPALGSGNDEFYKEILEVSDEELNELKAKKVI